MVRIAETAEKSIDYGSKLATMQFKLVENVTNAISYATCAIALQLKAAAIISATESGQTARMISRFRAYCPILATTTNSRVQRQLCISWGVIPSLVKEALNVEEMFEIGVEKALEIKLVKKGDTIVITAGGPVGIVGTTNLLKVQTVGDNL